MISCSHWRQRHRSQQLCCSVGGGCHGDRAGGDAANGLLALLLQGGDHHWETDGQRSALRRRLQQPLLLAQGWVAQVRSGWRTIWWVVELEPGSYWWWVTALATCF